MEFDRIVEKLKARWPDIEAPAVENGERFVIVPADDNLHVLEYLKTEPGLEFDTLMSLVGADTGAELWVVYPIHSLKHNHRLLVKVVLPRENAEINSAVGLWKMADFFEREAYDLYGIKFVGHPDLRRILNPPDWEGWAGRKDFEYPMEYQGIPTVRADQFFADAVDKGIQSREEQEKAIVAQAQEEYKKEQAEKAKAGQ